MPPLRVVAALGASLVVAAALPPPAEATIFQGQESANLFGNLNQADTACANVACGPSAAVNSLVFLQKRYPNLYGNRLVPAATKTTSEYQQMVAVANSLGTNDYMNSCNCGTGTYIEEFIAGKQKYFNSVAPGTTSFDAQMTQNTWRQKPGGVNVGPKPSYVQLNTAPTAQFLASQLKAGEDVELFINGSEGNHYVTLTQIYYDTNSATGNFIKVVDPNQPTSGGPAGPPTVTQLAINGLDPTDSDILLSGGLAYLGTGLNIVNAVAESPIPEPPALALGVLGIGVLGWMRRRWPPHDRRNVHATPA